MKHCAIVLLTILLSTQLSAQRANYWVMDRVGFDFTSGQPQVFLTGMNGFENTSAICDDQGNLLFYTNGGTWTNSQGPGFIGAVFDANHQVMPNGWLVDTAGCYSSDKGLVILPDPGNADEYYIFTQDCQEAVPNKGMRYTKVNLSLNGGWGAVTDIGIEAIPPSGVGGIFSGLPEYLVALPGGNPKEYWVLAFKGDSLCRVYMNAQGVSAYQCQGLFVRNRMIASPKGDQVIIGSVLYYFNNVTGEISKPTPLPVGVYYEFSPNGRMIYAVSSVVPADASLYQFNQDNPLFPFDTISLGKEIEGIPVLAPNCRIYLLPGFNSTSYVIAKGVIHHPNAPGLACNFQDTVYASVAWSVNNETFRAKPTYYKPYAYSEDCPLGPPEPLVPDFEFPSGPPNAGDIKEHISPVQINVPVPVHDGLKDDEPDSKGGG